MITCKPPINGDLHYIVQFKRVFMALMKRHLHKQIIFRFNKPRQNNDEAFVLKTDYIFGIHRFHTVKYISFPRGMFQKFMIH